MKKGKTKEKREYPTPNRKYKDHLFRIVFSNKADLLALYNAVNRTDYQNPDELEVNTLEDVVYLSMKNDISFLIDGTLNLYEHQSTANPNMPCRGLLYLARTYDSYIDSEGINLLNSPLKKLPMPIYLVFYNGTENEPDKTVQKLSDAFLKPQRNSVDIVDPDLCSPCLECKAVMLNINYGHNRELMEKCRRLEEYAIFVATVRRYKGNGPLTSEIVERAVDECIKAGVLADILAKQKAEVIGVVLTSFNQEAYDKDLLEEGKKQMAKLIQNLLSENRLEDIERATIDEQYREQLMKEYGLN